MFKYYGWIALLSTVLFAVYSAYRRNGVGLTLSLGLFMSLGIFLRMGYAYENYLLPASLFLACYSQVPLAGFRKFPGWKQRRRHFWPRSLSSLRHSRLSETR